VFSHTVGAIDDQLPGQTIAVLGYELNHRGIGKGKNDDLRLRLGLVDRCRPRHRP